MYYWRCPMCDYKSAHGPFYCVLHDGPGAESERFEVVPRTLAVELAEALHTALTIIEANQPITPEQYPIQAALSHAREAGLLP